MATARRKADAPKKEAAAVENPPEEELEPELDDENKAGIPLVPADAKVFERVIWILEELPAIGKDTENTQQHFMYRSHDAVLNALNPLLAKYGVFMVPTVLDRITDQRPTRSGGVMYEVNLHVQYAFYGPMGDRFLSSAWGEGTDSGDKATNKAMTMAFKNVIAQVFAVSTADTIDTDSTSDPETIGRSSASRQSVAQRREDVRVDPQGPERPTSWSEAFERFNRLVADDGQGQLWAAELVRKRFGKDSLSECSSDERTKASVGFFSTLMALESVEGEVALREDFRDLVARAFAERNEGVALVGPEYALGPAETAAGLPSREDYYTTQAALAGVDDPQEEKGDADGTSAD